MVVEDDESTRIALTKILQMDGYHVDSFSNGYEAMSFLRLHEVDLVMSDINMPEMNGVLFLKALQAGFPNIHVIMITAYGRLETYIESINHGAVEYLNKPIDYKQLKAIINKVFQEST